MVSSDNQSPTLGEAASRFLAKLSSQEREASQPEVYKFARWYGWEHPFANLAAPAVASYAEQLSLSDTDYARKLVLIRAFLAYAKKKGWSRTNLASHLKTKKAKSGQLVAARRNLPESISLTQQKHDELEAELAALKEKRHELIDEIRRAAADKDFRENAPLAAAREQRGHVEGQIRELEETLKAAIIIDGKREPALKTGVGDNYVVDGAYLLELAIPLYSYCSCHL